VLAMRPGWIVKKRALHVEHCDLTFITGDGVFCLGLVTSGVQTH
jgi:hypothetical protein